MAHRGRRRRGEPPAYLHHKASKRAYVFLNGKAEYLGPYGSAESRTRYREIVKRWEQELDHDYKRYGAAAGCSLVELVAAHAEFARQHYRTPDGDPTSEQRSFVLSLRPLLSDTYATLPADEFRPAHLKEIREALVHTGLARKTVNQSIGRIRRLFRWAVGEELVSLATAGALAMVKDLAEGRTPAPDHDEVEPVPMRDLAAVLRFSGLRADVDAMIRLQYYCGARPGEVCRMLAEEVDQGGIVHVKKRKVQLPGGVWVFQPGRFKQKRTGRIVAYVLGRRAQAVLAPFLQNEPVFGSPKKLGAAWSVSGYQHAIADACAAVGCGHWSPGQLRHNYLSRMDAAAGIQLASYAVGHASIDTTAIYVERNLKAVAEAVGKLG